MGVFRAENEAGGGGLLKQTAGAGDGPGHVVQQLFGGEGVPGLDVGHRPHRDRRDCALVRGVAVLRGQTSPGAVFLVLPDAERALRRRPLRGLIEDTRGQPEDVDRCQPQGASDGGIGAGARPEHVRTRVEPDAVPHGAVDEQQRRDARRRLPHAGADEAFGTQCVPRREDDREVLGPATGHRRIDRRQPHGAGPVEVPESEDDLVRRTVGLLEKQLEELRRAGHRGKAVGPALVVAVLQNRGDDAGVHAQGVDDRAHH